MSENPTVPGIYICVVAEENGERAECCMWDGSQWLWWSTFFDPPEWDPVTHCNCQVIGWTEPVLWNVDQPTSALRASTAAAGDVLAERKRQREKEGWTEAHDDEHEIGEMSQAAACYAASAGYGPGARVPERWPWAHKWWKPSDRRRDLVKAGALILAEIERLDRSGEKP